MTPDLFCMITSDPRASGRPAECIRIAAGLASWKELALAIYLEGPAALLLGEQAIDLVDGDVYPHYLPLIREAGSAFLIGEENNWLGAVAFSESFKVQRAPRRRLIELCAQAKYLLRF